MLPLKLELHPLDLGWYPSPKPGKETLLVQVPIEPQGLQWDAKVEMDLLER